MRIIAGQMRGRRLVAPTGTDTRPTSDRVRESIFAILGDITGCDVLDLFAGSGAMALEALSRGAHSALCVDTAPKALHAIRANATILDDGDRLRTRRADWRRALADEAAAGRRYGLCLLDPPYSLLPRITGDLAGVLAPVLQPAATIVVEGAASDGPVDIPGLCVANRIDRTYGSTSITIIHTDVSQ